MSETSLATATPNINHQALLEFQSPEKPNQYRAIGLVKGQFIAQEGSTRHGILVTADQPFPAKILRYRGKLPQGEAIWRVWVKTNPHEEGLNFHLKSYVKDAEDNVVDPSHLEQDYFSIRGQLLWWKTKEGEENKQFAILSHPFSLIGRIGWLQGIVSKFSQVYFCLFCIG